MHTTRFRTKHRVAARLTLSAAVVLLAACAGSDATAPCTVSAVTVTPANAALRVGNTTQLSSTVSAQDCGASPAVVWSTGDASIATVSGSGLVTAVAVGTTTISATSQSVQSGATITVSLIPVQSVTVTAPSTTLIPGATAQAAAVVRDSTGATVTRPLAWTSSTATVATVNASGLVTAVGSGTTTITASAGGVNGTLAFTVAPAVASVETSLSQSVLFVGTARRSTATAIPRDAGASPLTGRTVAWSSTNTAVATVNATTGVVTPVSVGTTNIRATVEGVTGQSALTVSALPAESNRFGFAWNQLAAAPVDSIYSPLALYNTNGSGGPIRIRRTAVGRYTVEFEGLANPGPISETILVTPYSFGSAQCGVTSWGAGNITDLSVDVSCSSFSGVAQNANFVVAVVGSASLSGSFGFLATPSVETSPVTSSFRFTTGATAPSYTRNSTGVYDVALGIGNMSSGSQVLVTTYADALNRSCSINYWGNGQGTTRIRCVTTADQTLADARFSVLMFDSGRSGKRWGYAWNSAISTTIGAPYTPDPTYSRQSNGQQPTVTRQSSGVYTVRFPGLARAAGQSDVVLASAYAAADNTCVVGSWTSGGGDLTAEIRCFWRSTGALTDSFFTVWLLE